MLLHSAPSRLGLCGPGTLDSIREVCVREVWARLSSSFASGVKTLDDASVAVSKTHASTVYTRHCLLLHAQTTLFNRATTGIDPSIELQLVQ